jgi:NAD(P)-dependent dehydrogenase (short-subunit alcohol dehydrogenase family)
MLLNLSGKTALITGSSRGIGFAIARALNAEGCRVALNARDKECLKTSAIQLTGSIFVAGDMTQAGEARRVVDETARALGGLDILVCCVGGGRSVAPGCETPEEWQRIFALNFWSATNAIEAAHGVLEASKGAILCISSICGLEVIPDAPVTYSVAKAALHSYVRGIARPLGKKGIRINAIAPGNILFDGSVWAKKMIEEKDSVISMLENNVPLNRLGMPEDVANLSAYLVSDLANFATGGIWTLDGGQTR